MKFYTSDTHFGHARVIQYSKRPFASVEEMDDELIRRWNSIVRPKDEVYHLGDFAFAKPERIEDILKRLNGRKCLIIGNHDTVFLKYPELLEYLDRFTPMLEIYEQDSDERKGAKHIVLCHYGMRVWNKAHFGSFQFYGHSHGSLQGNSQSCDVGVDCWDYAPVTYKEIKQRLQSLPPFRPVDHHN